LSKAMELTGARRGCIYIINKENRLERRTPLPEEIQKALTDRYPMHIVKRVFETGESVIIEDALSDTDEMRDAGAPPAGFKSVLCVPIIEQDRTIGVCYLDNSLSIGVFTEKERDLILAFLSSVALAIQIKLMDQGVKYNQEPGRRLSKMSVPTEKILMAIEYIDNNYTSEISREGLAAKVGMHHDNLGKYFKLYSGKKMNDYINELRVKKAAQMLKETDEKINDIAYAVGFRSMGTFNKVFYQFMKVAPVHYRKMITP
jgi:AraC-like DNA-binding protein